MFHVLFLVSVYISGQIRKTETVHVFPEYYYDAGGKLKLTITGASLRGVSLRVVPKIALTILFRGSEYEVFCNNTFDVIFPPREPDTRVPHGLGRADTWNLEVRVKGIFVPILTNCEKQDISYAVQYSNPSNLLDLRDQPIAKFYFGTACVYPFVMLIWLVNGIKHSQFRVNLHTLFALAAIAKAVSAYFKGKYWVSRQSSDFLSDTICAENALFWMVAHSLLLLANSLGAMGWGSARETLPLCDFLYPALLCVNACTGISLATENLPPLYVVLVLCLIGFASMQLAKLLYEALDRALYLMHSFDENAYPVIHKKLGVQVRFFQIVFLYLLAGVFISLFVIIFNDCVFVKSVVFEVDVLGLFLVDMYVFLLRAEYSGATELVEVVEPENVAIQEENDDIMLIEGPQDEKTLCIVSAQRVTP